MSGESRSLAGGRARAGACATVAAALVLAASTLVASARASAAAQASSSSSSSTQAAPGPATAREADDRLAFWLERRGLDRLLSALLEQRLAREAAELDRRDAAERLRDVVGRRLRAGDLEPEAAAAIAEKIRQWLPAVDAEELALEVLRSRQRSAEARLDRLRLGVADPSEGAAIATALQSLAADVDKMRRRIEVTLQGDDRKLERSVGLEAEALLDDVDRKRVVLETARFVHAWTMLHSALLARSSLAAAPGGAPRKETWRAAATTALEHFTLLLDTGVADPTPDDVGVERRGDENYASALLGASIARLLLEGPERAESWFALVADPRTASASRRSASGWKLMGLVLTREFAAARSWLDALLAKGPVPASWLRAAIVECRATDVMSQPGAAEFVQAALAALASQEELGEVIALAEGLPTTALPADGFLAGYLRGIREYAAARSLDPSTSEYARREAFRAAARTLRGAAGGSDASRSSSGLGSARQLAGWCLIGAGDFEEAGALFELAAESLPPPRAAESLWLAAEALDRAMRTRDTGDHEALVEARRRLIDRLIERFPESEFAVRAEVVRIRQDPEADSEALAKLRSIPRGSPAWIEALVAAEELLYRRVRRSGGSASEPERRRAVEQYLEVARADDAPDAATRRTWLRRRAEAALIPGADRTEDAAAAIVALRARAAAGEFPIDDIESELRLRELQIAAASGRLDDAASRLREFEAQDASGTASPFVRLGRRALLRGAQKVDTDAARAMVIEVGSRIVRDESTTLEPAARHAVALAVGSAARTLVERRAAAGSAGNGAGGGTKNDGPGGGTKKDDETGANADAALIRTALDVLVAALVHRPADFALLDTTATIAERVGDDERALECLRAILAGAPIGEPVWFDARVRQVRVLSRHDPALARRVLDQHRALVPDWGPEPWGGALRDLDRRVPSVPAVSAPAGAGAET